MEISHLLQTGENPDIAFLAHNASASLANNVDIHTSLKVKIGRAVVPNAVTRHNV
jgi:hypothetical protein